MRGPPDSARSSCTPSSTTGLRTRTRPTTFTGISPMRHEKPKLPSTSQTQAGSTLEALQRHIPLLRSESMRKYRNLTNSNPSPDKMRLAMPIARSRKSRAWSTQANSETSVPTFRVWVSARPLREHNINIEVRYESRTEVASSTGGNEGAPNFEHMPDFTSVWSTALLGLEPVSPSCGQKRPSYFRPSPDMPAGTSRTCIPLNRHSRCHGVDPGSPPLPTSSASRAGQQHVPSCTQRSDILGFRTHSWSRDPSSYHVD
jgi:hypothetical protein